MTIPEKLLDQLIADYQKVENRIGENNLRKQLTQRLLECAIQTEPTERLKYIAGAT
ncbi:MAG: hypothetical protein FWD79_10485 [Desulfobulbus sp.]|nr:hypothetical protein [Desulfobulbus sp.]